MTSDVHYEELIYKIAQELAEKTGLSFKEITKQRSFLYSAVFVYRFCEDMEEEYRIQVVIATDKKIDGNHSDFKSRALVVLKNWKELIDEARCRKYKPLEHLLLSCYAKRIYMEFKEIERVIQNDLSEGAYRNNEWWKNDRYYVQANAWLNAGYKVERVEFQNQIVVFKKDSS